MFNLYFTLFLLFQPTPLPNNANKCVFFRWLRNEISGKPISHMSWGLGASMQGVMVTRSESLFSFSCCQRRELTFLYLQVLVSQFYRSSSYFPHVESCRRIQILLERHPVQFGDCKTTTEARGEKVRGVWAGIRVITLWKTRGPVLVRHQNRLFGQESFFSSKRITQKNLSGSEVKC